MDGEPGDNAIHHGDIQELPFTRLFPVDGRSENGDGSHHSPSTDIGNLNSRKDGVSVFRSRYPQHTSQADVIDIMTGPLLIGSVLPVSREGT